MFPGDYNQEQSNYGLCSFSPRRIRKLRALIKNILKQCLSTASEAWVRQFIQPKYFEKLFKGMFYKVPVFVFKNTEE